MSLGTKSSFFNAPWDFLHISKFQVNVSVTMFLVSNTFQNILDGFASFQSQRDIYKNTVQVYTIFGQTLAIWPV